MKTSGVMSCVRSRRNMAAVTSSGAGPPGANGFAARTPVYSVGVGLGALLKIVRGYCPLLSFEYISIARPICRRLLAHVTRLACSRERVPATGRIAPNKRASRAKPTATSPRVEPRRLVQRAGGLAGRRGSDREVIRSRLSHFGDRLALERCPALGTAPVAR